MKLIFAMLTACCLPMESAAQDAWDYSASIYAWIPGLDADVDTAFGNLASRSSGGDVLDNLDMALMGTFEARKDRWGLLLDVVYADLSTSKDSPFGLLFSQADVEVKLAAASGYALYRSYESPRLSLDAGFGVRGFSVDLDTRLETDSGLGDVVSSGDKSWALPLVALRANVPISDRWFASAFVDYGWLSSDETTFQGVATVGYRFNDRWEIQGGYRYMELEQEFSGRDADLKLKGPVIGLRARF